MKYILIFNCLFASTLFLNAAVYQWSVPANSIISQEIYDHPTAFLWIPENCEQVRAVVLGQHNMCEETIFEHPYFRKTMSELGFAIVWITPGIDQQWDVTKGCNDAFEKLMIDLSETSGYVELKHAPIVPLGHSAMATFPWNFAAWNPERTLAVISYKGDAPRTNLTGYGRENLEWGRTRNIDGIPGIMIEGEYEWWEARVNPALAFRMMYPNSCISFLYDAGQGHFDVSDKVVDYICLFLKKAAKYRLPKDQAVDETTRLMKLNPKNGWLAERWQVKNKKREKPAPFNIYKGNKHDAFWYFDEEMAFATEQYYEERQNREMQYIGFEINGKLLPFKSDHHAQYQVSNIKTHNHIFNLNAVFTDSTHSKAIGRKINGDIKIDRICGPVIRLNDSTFQVSFYRMGMNSQKRSGDIWLLAHHPGDKKWKSAVQQINIKVPFNLKNGVHQEILFKEIKNVKASEKSIFLEAKSSAGLPVSFYIKEGPARIINNNTLVFTKIPPRSNFPMKVTVVAWQNGTENGDLVQSAKPVERTFLIDKN